MLDTPKNRMPDLFSSVTKNKKDTRLIHKSLNYKRKMLEALLIGKLVRFNLSAGQWGLDDLTSSLVSKAFPRRFDLGPPPET